MNKYKEWLGDHKALVGAVVLHQLLTPFILKNKVPQKKKKKKKKNNSPKICKNLNQTWAMQSLVMEGGMMLNSSPPEKRKEEQNHCCK